MIRDDSDDESDENIVLKMDNSSDDYETVSESETDSSYSPQAKPTNIKQRIRKNIIESESDNDDDEDEDEDDGSSDDDKSAINPRELRKTIATLFPSNYINKKVKADDRESKRTKKQSRKTVHRKRCRRYKSESEDEDDDSASDCEGFHAVSSFVWGACGDVDHEWTCPVGVLVPGFWTI